MRARDIGAHAGSVVRAAFADRGSAGGHGTFAGGQIDVRGKEAGEVASLAAEILDALVMELGFDPADGEPLISSAPEPT